MRLVFNLALIISLLYLPWWAGALVALSACFLVDRFFEVVVYGILADALYGNRFGVYGFGHLAAAYTLLILVIGLSIRKRLAW